MSIQDKTLPLCTFLKHPECGLHLQVGAYVVPCGKKPWYCELFTLSEAKESEVTQSSSTLRPWPTRLLGFPGKSTGVGCRFLLQVIFPTQGSNLDFLHCRQTLYRLSHQVSLF